MKNIFLLATALLGFSILSKAQNQDSLAVIEKAESWFKSTYVEKLFKDPYSYRLMKITAEPINRERSISDSILYLDQLIEECDIPLDLRTEKERMEWQEFYDESMVHVNQFNEDVKNGKEISDFDLKRNEIYKKAAKDALENITEHSLLDLNTRERDRLLILQTQLDVDERKQLSHYLIKLDCYSKNSYGNEVLGRYSFPFTNEGVLGSGDGISNVVDLSR